jgi:hypothetical protein
VRDEDDGVGVLGEVLLKPVARVEIEVVRRLVEEQEAGPAEQQPGKSNAHLPAAGERLGRLVHVVPRETESAQHGVDLEVDAVPFEPPETLLQLAIPAQHLPVLGLRDAVVSQPAFERANLVAHVEQVFERLARLFHERASAVMKTVLRKVPDGEAARLDHQPRVRFFQPAENSQERGFAGAVRATQPDPLAIVDLPAHRVE